MTIKPDQVIYNRYKILARLGQGGMGEVWKATDQQLGDEVVIKMPLSNSDSTLLKRFGIEAQMMRKHSIGNPNILDIQGVGDVDGTPYYVMRFLPGGSLEDRCPLVDSDNPEFKVEAFEWLISIGKALDYLHGHGVLHRDVKPANILFNQSGDGYLADFGIAKNPTEVTSFSQAATATGTSPGTFAYMAPEVLNPEPDMPATGAVDQYALGVTLYETIAGKRPYAATNVIKLYHQTQQGCTPLKESLPNIPLTASKAVVRALAPDPQDRFHSCREFAETFLAGLSGKIAIPAAPPVASPSEAETGMVSVGGTGESHVVGGTPVVRSGQSSGSKGDSLFNDNRGRVVPKKPAGLPASGTSKAPALIGGGALLLALIAGGLFLSGAFSGETNQPQEVSPGSSLAATVSDGSEAKEDFSGGSDAKDDFSEGSEAKEVADLAASKLTAPFGRSEIDTALSSLKRTKGLEPEIKNYLGMKFRLIPAGEFIMGSPEDEPDRADDEIQHRVEISREFYLGVTEVTQGQWKELMGTEPWKSEDFVKEGENYPAVYVSWEDALEFCEKLSKREGVEYRLPSEAEWEYACRGGSNWKYHFGNTSTDLGKYAWHDVNADDVGEEYAHEVGQKLANGFGLHDMHGNVWEWCGDCYGEDYYKVSPSRDPAGPEDDASRVLRGGGWSDTARLCRSAFRGWDSPGYRFNFLGFRVLRSSIK